MKYVYCLARDIPSVPDALPTGLGGAEVHDISFRGIAALISDTDSHQLVGSEQNALAHHQVVDAALRLSKSVIPCRFGTLFPDGRSILMFLTKHHARLEKHLTTLEGKMEVSVQAILSHRDADFAEMSRAKEETRGQDSSARPFISPSLGPGASYLLQKKEQLDAMKELEEKAHRLSQEVSQAMSSFWSDVKIQKHSTGKALLLSLCYLVDQQKLPSFKHAYQKFKQGNPGLRLLYSGPWAPYSFAHLDLSVDERKD